MAGETPSHPVRASGFLALMRNRDYALLWTSQGVSLLGDRFHWVAISLWVYASTGSALSVSYAVIALMIGPAAVGLFAGVLVDRLDRKWTMIVADVVRGILVALIPALMKADVRLVYLDLFLISCATTVFRPAMLATLPQIVAKGDLLPANSFFTTVDTATEILGPASAGLLVGLAGYSAAMYVDASSYFVSALILGFLSVSPRPVDQSRRKANRVGTDLMAGFLYISRDRLQLGLFALIFLGWWVSGLNSLQTPLAKGSLGLTDIQFGWFNSVWGAGFLAASLLLGWYGNRLSKGWLLAVGFLGWILATASAGASMNAGMLFASIFWVGASNIILFVSLSTIIMEVTPQDMMGRVLTARQVALALVRVCSMLLFGLVADNVSVRVAVLAMSGVSLIGIILGFAIFPEVLRAGAPVAARILGLPDTSALLRGANRALAMPLVMAMDTAYGTGPQRMLNMAVLIMVGAAWSAMILVHPVTGVFLALVVGITIAVKAIHAQWERRLASKNLLLRVGGAERESRGRRRTPQPTGPTVEQ